MRKRRKWFPGRMTLTEWRRTPYRKKHRLLGITLNTRVFRYWRDCKDARCRRARKCQDHECYWRRLHMLPVDDRERVRGKAEPWTGFLRLGSNRGAEGRKPY